MSLADMVKDARTIAIVCNQWGDTGKGKFVDYFAEWADVVARGNGGANAGHTIVIDGKKYVYHLLPSGMLHGKINIIGPGVAFDPKIAQEELEAFGDDSAKNLKIAYNAKLVMPQHLILDRISDRHNGSIKIGTTGKGMGPVYTDYVARIGLTVNDMLNPDVFTRKLRNNLENKIAFLEHIDSDALKKAFNHPDLRNGIFYKSKGVFDIDAITEVYMKYGRFFKEMIHDTEAFIHESLGRKNILLEGAQGLMLSVDYGSYPFVTSSDCSINGLAKGVGIRDKDIDLVFGIVKAFYMTRVGEGPFPTELGGDTSSVWCSTHSRENEEIVHASINSQDEFEQGIAIRRYGNEYGATTGRPRRTGWLDLPLLRYASQINGREVILTKLDVLDDCDLIKICGSYLYTGKDYRLGNMIIKSGDMLQVAVHDTDVLKHCSPVYQIFKGWKTPIGNITSYENLPGNLKSIIEYVASNGGVHIRALSVGSDRNQTITMPT